MSLGVAGALEPGQVPTQIQLRFVVVMGSDSHWYADVAVVHASQQLDHASWASSKSWEEVNAGTAVQPDEGVEEKEVRAK